MCIEICKMERMEKKEKGGRDGWMGGRTDRTCLTYLPFVTRQYLIMISVKALRWNNNP